MDIGKEMRLLEALRNGSEKAFESVYRKHRAVFLNFGRKYGLNDPDLLDIYQEAYIVFYQNVVSGKLQELKSSIGTYILAIGKNKIREHLRRTGRLVHAETILDNQTEEESVFDGEEEMPTERQRILAHQFALLGKKCQEVLKWFYYQGYDIATIRKKGNYSSDNVVKSHKSRCLKTLKERMR